MNCQMVLRVNYSVTFGNQQKKRRARLGARRADTPRAMQPTRATYLSSKICTYNLNLSLPAIGAADRVEPGPGPGRRCPRTAVRGQGLNRNRADLALTRC